MYTRTPVDKQALIRRADAQRDALHDATAALKADSRAAVSPRYWWHRIGDKVSRRLSPPASVHRRPVDRVRPEPPAPLPGWVAPVALFLLGRAARRLPALRFASWGLSAWLAWKEAAAQAEAATPAERTKRRIEP
jgi:hypothetical protein